MSKVGEPAIPAFEGRPMPNTNLPLFIPIGGLSKRDYFAAMAMQGMLGNQKINPQWVDLPLEAVQKADHLLAELSKERSEPGKEK
ncbi:hypothetical protein E6Q11_02380 [Candidatus Dojkabacteria bacterium]|uniref:Uncharacterized protein n=1 Tax=Candidatus Dojkabacteria bacterium TaxID=2099670 RepID=A0A5C7J7P4_9BACT|nr:MAG: hypothetical protein E6Q11_02380 [Candidatus Dojkabacteria bacterium]